MSVYPVSPKEMTRGVMYFPRMLDKIRLHARGELGADYQANFGAARAADRMCCNMLRVEHVALRERVLAGGTDDEILEWCYATGRRLNDRDVIVWNGFISKMGWNDFAAPFLERIKKQHGIVNRPDIATFSDLIDFDEKRIR